jgi:glycerate dehydrogenase
MKIVVLDGYTLNPGDLSWDDLKNIGDVVIYDRTPEDKTLERAENAQIVLTNKVILDKKKIEALPKLTYIGVLATGYNVIDLKAASDRGITVTNIPAYSTDSVAQNVFAHLLEITQNVSYHSRRVFAGAWVNSKDFSFWEKPLVELSGMTMGIIGFGRIGKAVANLAQAFGMNVIVYNRSAIKQLPQGIKAVSLDRIFDSSDVISLHCPLTDDNYQMINVARLNRMKRSAILINTARGALIDEQALADALNSGRIYAAGLDVLSSEPPKESNPLLKAKNCFITPHIAWATRAARSRLMDIAVNNIKSFIEGRPVNVVNS